MHTGWFGVSVRAAGGGENAPEGLPKGRAQAIPSLAACGWANARTHAVKGGHCGVGGCWRIGALIEALAGVK